MAFGLLAILYTIIAFSFVVTSIFMFVPKNNPTVNKIFFALAVALAFFVTVISATSLPTNFRVQIAAAWAGLIFAAIGVIIRVAKGKTSMPANLLVMLSTAYGIAGYFLFM